MIIFHRLNGLFYNQLKKNFVCVNSVVKLKSKVNAKSIHFTLVNLTDQDSTNSKSLGIPPILPVNCCGTGCQNCAWLQYAEEMLKFYGNSYSDTNREAVHKSIMEEINKLEDENLKVFLTMELKMKLNQ